MSIDKMPKVAESKNATTERHTSIDHKEDLNFGRFTSAVGVFVRTPMRKLLRTLPPKPIELGGERKVFDLDVFVLESWRSAADKKQFNVKSYETMEAFSKYITRIDDILDGVNHPSINEWNIYKADKVARKTISIFVSRVLEMEREKLLNPQQVKEIFKAAGNYRRQSRAALEHFEKLENPTIDEILKVKEITTGGMGSVMIEILSTAEKIPVEQRKVLTKAFSDAFMATQVADDMHDIHDDIKARVPNIAVAVLQKYPQESNALIGGKTTTIGSYRKLAPKSYVELMQIGQTYISLIPKQPESIQVLDAIPKLFYKAVQLTSR